MIESLFEVNPDDEIDDEITEILKKMARLRPTTKRDILISALSIFHGPCHDKPSRDTTVEYLLELIN